LRLFKVSELLDLLKLLTELVDLLGEILLFLFKLCAEELILVSHHVLTVSEASLDLEWPDFHVPELLNIILLISK